MQKKFNFLLILTLMFVTETSFAVKEVVFRKQTHVYAKKNENSEVLGVYDRGDSVPISSQKYGSWRKVIVDVGGKKKAGWVLAKDLKGAKIADSKVRSLEKEEEKTGIPVYHRHFGVGLMGNLSYVYQSKGDLTFDTTGGPIKAEYSSLSGANTFVGFFGDYNLTSTMSIRGYFAMRNMKRSGSVTVQGNSGNVTVTHDLMTFGSTLKMYASPNAIFWWGPGVELAKTTKFTLKGSTSLPTTFEGDVSDDPMYVLLTLSAGYDFNISGRVFILPEVKVGVVPNGDPMAMTFEVIIPLAYTF